MTKKQLLIKVAQLKDTIKKLKESEGFLDEVEKRIDNVLVFCYQAIK